MPLIRETDALPHQILFDSIQNTTKVLYIFHKRNCKIISSKSIPSNGAIRDTGVIRDTLNIDIFYISRLLKLSIYHSIL